MEIVNNLFVNRAAYEAPYRGFFLGELSLGQWSHDPPRNRNMKCPSQNEFMSQHLSVARLYMRT